MQWFAALWRFSGAGAVETDVDVDVIPKVVGKTVCPRLSSSIRCQWDTLSARQTRAVVAAIRNMLEFEPAAEAKQVRFRQSRLSCVRLSYLLYDRARCCERVLPVARL
jgi:hypothetical protein